MLRLRLKYKLIGCCMIRMNDDEEKIKMVQNGEIVARKSIGAASELDRLDVPKTKPT